MKIIFGLWDGNFQYQSNCVNMYVCSYCVFPEYFPLYLVCFQHVCATLALSLNSLSMLFL